MKDLLKFLTCGNVDDGKSTLIGNLLYNAKLLYADQKNSVELESNITKNSSIDYSLLLDGLMAEQEQKITIDVAYRFFSTKKRSFIVADSPGHEQYTKNMAVAASFADLAILLIDASRGLQNQTLRHINICKLIGLKNFIFVINKIDLINYNEKKFNALSKKINAIVKSKNIINIKTIPISATNGDNIIHKSNKTKWYKGFSLLHYLENFNDNSVDKEKGFIFPVQRVTRPNSNFRGYQGQIECGEISVNNKISILPNLEETKIKSIYLGNKKIRKGIKGQSITLELSDEIDISRGNVICKNNNLKIGNTFNAIIFFMNNKKYQQGKSLLIKIACQQTNAIITKINYCLDITNNNKINSKSVKKNDIAECIIDTAMPIVFDSFNEHKSLGRFILIDKMTNETCGCGVINYKISDEQNLFYHKSSITKKDRSRIKNQIPKTIWFTGLSGSGKSTLANNLEKKLFSCGCHTYICDGDNLRLGINKNLGFSKEGRSENIRRVAEIAKMMNDAGIIVLVALISPYKKDRHIAKQIIGDNNFYEIYLSTPLKICEKRDKKKLYDKAHNGKIKNFTGIDCNYEIPNNPDLIVDTSIHSVSKSTNIVYNFIKDKIIFNENEK